MELIIILLCVFVIVLVIGGHDPLEHFGTDTLADSIKTNIVSAFTGIGDKIANLFKVGFDPVIPDKIPCANGLRDDGTSCWKDTLPNGVGTIPQLNGCPNGWRDDGTSCWEDLKCTGGGNCKTECSGDWRPWTWHCDTHCDPINCNGCGCIKMNAFQRGSHCGNNQSNVAGLCYNNCPSGYHFAGGNLCEPDGGAGIKTTAFDRYKCPPASKPTHKKLTGALCYAEI